MARISIKRYLPRSLYGRAALILLVPIVTLQLVVGLIFIQRLYEDVTRQMTQNVSLEVELVLEAFDTGGADAMARMADSLDMDVVFPGGGVVSQRRFYDLSGRVMAEVLAASFDQLRAVDLISDKKQVQLAFDTTVGILELSFPRSRVSARNPHQLLVWMMATGIFMTLIAYLFLRNQLRPIRRLARAAEAFGKGQNETYVPRGAVEVRSAGSAFLNMRARIERQTQQRTMMLSGVSHDLRTPLTRLKLGLSMLDESPDIEALKSDANEMESLIEAFLDFARADAVEELEECDPVDLAKSLVESAVRVGKKIEIGEIPDRPVVMKMRPLAIRRALDNLIGNGVRYGTRARVSVDAFETALRFRVEDDGPGIPQESQEEALKPFARLDAARNQNKGSGVGLGLAIAADITRSHGGTLRLGSSEDLGGLSAEIVLPL